MREGIRPPKFAEKFFRIDFDATPLPVLCLYPIPEPLPLEKVRIEVTGLEEHSRSIPWSNLASLPRVSVTVPLICQIFNWSETVTWEGIRLVDLLDYLRVETHPEGYYAVYSRDGVYFETLSRDEARDPRVLLAFGLNGGPLPEAHGGPLRLVVPFLQGYKSVKWVGAVRAFRNDPVGIKRLLGQSPSGQLNAEWRERYAITVPEGKAGDPPLIETPATTAGPLPAPDVQAPAEENFLQARPASDTVRRPVRPTGPMREIVAIVRPEKKKATREALEAAGIAGYTTYPVLGRSHQRGLKSADDPTDQAAIRFLPKQLFSIVVDARRTDAAVAALIKANQTGKGEYGDGKIFVLEVDEAVRISSDERGGAAL